MTFINNLFINLYYEIRLCHVNDPLCTVNHFVPDTGINNSN